MDPDGLLAVAEAVITGKISLERIHPHYWELVFRQDTDLLRSNGKAYVIKGNSVFLAFTEAPIKMFLSKQKTKKLPSTNNHISLRSNKIHCIQIFIESNFEQRL